MSWFTDRRQEWIALMLDVYGFINREHIVRMFGVSVPQASADLKQFMRENPNAIVYNASAKRYEPAIK